MCARRSPRHRQSPADAVGQGLPGAFFSIWGRVGLMCALAVIFASALTRPASPVHEDPTLLGVDKTVTTDLGAVDIAAVKVYSSGALVEVHAQLASTPEELLARPDQVLTSGDFSLTLRNKASGAGIGTARTLSAGRSLNAGAAMEPRTHHWDLAFWVPERPGRTPRRTWCGRSPTWTYPSN